MDMHNDGSYVEVFNDLWALAVKCSMKHAGVECAGVATLKTKCFAL